MAESRSNIVSPDSLDTDPHSEKSGRRGARSVPRRLFLLLATVTTLAVFTLGALVVWRTVMQLRAREWPIAKGKVVRCEITPETGMDNKALDKVDFLVGYKVDGREYETERWRFLAVGLPPHRLRKGAVDVHYAPDNPADGVLLAGLQDDDRLAILFTLPMVLFPGSLWLSALWRRLTARRVEFSAPVYHAGHTERVAISPMRAFGAALLGLLLGQMAALFIGPLWTGTGPRAFAWLLAGGPTGVVIVSTVALLARRAGAGQMILNGDAGTIRFKGSAGMAAGVVTADVSQLTSVGLWTRRTPLWPVYSVIVRVRAADQTRPREYRVGSWMDRRKCDLIVDWLADRLSLPREDNQNQA